MPSIFKHKNGHIGPDPLSPQHRKLSLPGLGSGFLQKTTKAGQDSNDMRNPLLYYTLSALPQFLQAAAEELP